jgi:predicted negative regulator of RcsB-dependent stress response
MATHLDFEEQEQIDRLKAFWKQYGNLVTWTLILALGAFAAWTGWQNWQARQAAQASAMSDELERAAQAGDTDRVGKVFNDLKATYPRTVFAAQAGLQAARAQLDKGLAEAARDTLQWVADSASADEYRAIARLHLAGLLIDQKQYDAAARQLDAAMGQGFDGLVADRRGDLLMAQGKTTEAAAAYQAAWKALDPALEYRRLVDAKLASLGLDAEASAAATGSVK